MSVSIIYIYVKYIGIIYTCEIYIYHNCVVLAHSSSLKQGQIFTALWCRQQLKLAWFSGQKAPVKADMLRSCSKTVVLLVTGK